MAPPGAPPGEDERSREDRRLEQLLAELRVAMPGVQVLFAFLLAVPFQARFDQITDFQRMTYFVALLCSALATILFVAPTAFHRLTFRHGHKAELVRLGSRMAIGGLVALALAMLAAVLLITDLLFAATAVVAVTVAVMAVVFALAWFGLALAHRSGGAP